MAPRYPPTPSSQLSSEYKPYAEWLESEIAPVLGPNGKILTYQDSDGALQGPFPVIIASKEAGKAISETTRQFGTLEKIPNDAKEVAILTVGCVK